MRIVDDRKNVKDFIFFAVNETLKKKRKQHVFQKRLFFTQTLCYCVIFAGKKFCKM